MLHRMGCEQEDIGTIKLVRLVGKRLLALAKTRLLLFSATTLPRYLKPGDFYFFILFVASSL